MDEKETKEIIDLLHAINNKLDASGIGLLAEADASNRIEELLKQGESIDYNAIINTN